jgi:hypothetical protein
MIQASYFNVWDNGTAHKKIFLPIEFAYIGNVHTFPAVYMIVHGYIYTLWQHFAPLRVKKNEKVGTLDSEDVHSLVKIIQIQFQLIG